jgi:hypothetical protein
VDGTCGTGPNTSTPEEEPVMELFAILHKPTGTYMPAKMSESKRAGWTNWKPGAKDQKYGAGPRLFAKKRAADLARGYWLKGKAKVHWNQYGEDEGYSFVADPTRKPEDIVVVQVMLRFGD